MSFVAPRDGPRTQPDASAADHDVPALFATRVPADGLTPSLQAVAALIDEDTAVVDSTPYMCPHEARFGIWYSRYVKPLKKRSIT